MNGGGWWSRVQRIAAALSCLAAFVVIVIVVVKPVYDRAPAKPSSPPVEAPPPAPVPRTRSAVAGGESVALVVRPGARLDVEVVDDAGTRMYGVRVTARPEKAGPVEEAIHSRFDRDVAFSLAADVPYTIRVEHPGFETVEIPNVRGGAEPLRVVLVRKR